MYLRKAHSPFSLYTRKFPGRTSVWYVRFWDEQAQRFGKTRSTGVEATGKRLRRAEADTVARELLVSVSFTQPEVQVSLLEYIEEFWTPESRYVREKALIDKRPLTNAYIKNSHDVLVTHVRPFPRFASMELRNLKPGDIRDWMLERARSGVGPRRINAALQAMRVAVKEAFNRGDLASNPFLGVGIATDTPKEKGVLTAAEVSLLENTEHSDPRVKLVMLLGAKCCMRRGEAIGLQWSDIRMEANTIDLRHNHVRSEGLKSPKNGKARTTILTESVKTALEAVRAVSPYAEAEDFVVFGLGDRGTPVSDSFFRDAFCLAMVSIGVDETEQSRRNLSYHSLRHTWITLARLARIPDLAIQAIAGHKDSTMMEHYSHAAQALDFNEVRVLIESIPLRLSTAVDLAGPSLQ